MTFKIPETEWNSYKKESIRVGRGGIIKCGNICAIDSNCAGVFYDDITGTFGWQMIELLIQIYIKYFYKVKLYS